MTIVPHHTQRSKENGMVYIPYTEENMDIFQDIKVKPIFQDIKVKPIFQDIKVKPVQYGYFPRSGKVALVPCPHLPTRRKCVELYTPQNSRY